MIDWTVLLIPLALLPIVSLLTFVGCALDREGKLTFTKFTYQDGLNFHSSNFPGVDSLEWEYSLDLEVDAEWGGPGIIGSAGPETVGPFQRGTDDSDPIGPQGETHQHAINSDTHGTITVKCTVLTRESPSFEPTTYVLSTPKEKISGEPGPEFQLVRNGGLFSLI